MTARHFEVFANGTFWGTWAAKDAAAAIRAAVADVGTEGNAEGLTARPAARPLPALSRARMAAGMTQAQLGAKLGRNQSYINRIETGKTVLPAADALTLCQLFGLDLQTLMESNE